MARASRSRSLGAREGTVASQGRLLRRAGAVALIAGFTIKVALRFVDDPHFLTWLSGIASLVLIACGAFMLYRGRQWAAAERSLAASTHAPEAAPVVYLRSFALDESGRSRVLRALLFGFLTQAPFVQVRTEEEQLARAFAPIGPLIGLGEPREALPKPGATRLYATQWHESVKALLRRARLVILRPSVSESVLWEVEQTLKTVDPAKVVLMFRRVKAKDYERFRTTIAEAYSIQLPPFEDVRRRRRANAFVVFGAKWTPQVLPFKAPFWRVSPLWPMAHIFNYTLLPVFQRLGVAWEPSPVSIMKVVGVSISGAVLAFMVIGLGFSIVERLRNPTPAAMDSSIEYVVDALPPTSATPPEIGQTTPAANSVSEATVHTRPQLIAGLEIAVGGKVERIASPEQVETYVCRDGTVYLRVDWGHAKPGVAVSLDAVAQNILRTSAQVDGVKQFKSRTLETMVSGHRAIRATVSFVADEEHRIAEYLFLVVGQNFWAVQAHVAQMQDDGSATRIIDSVAVSPNVLD